MGSVGLSWRRLSGGRLRQGYRNIMRRLLSRGAMARGHLTAYFSFYFSYRSFTMAQVFQINSTNLSRITKADWTDEPGDNQALDGVTPLARWRRLVWRAEVLSAAEWNTLRVW